MNSGAVMSRQRVVHGSLYLAVLVWGGCLDLPSGIRDGASVSARPDPRTPSDLSRVGDPTGPLSLPSAPPAVLPGNAQNQPLGVVSVEPSKGLATEFTAVSIKGSGFTEGMQVLVGGTKALNPMTVGPDILNCVFPPHPPGMVDVQLLRPDGQTATLQQAFEYTSVVKLTDVEPSQGPESGGTPVLVKGEGLRDVEFFLFGGRIAVGVNVKDDNTAFMVTPPHSADEVSLIAVTQDGNTVRLDHGFTYTEQQSLPHPPGLRLDGCSPHIVPASGGETVYLQGAGFSPLVEVWIGGIPAQQVEFLGAGLLRVFVPPGSPGPAPVGVYVGGYRVTRPDCIEFAADETRVLALEPDKGSWAGGMLVKIYGTGLGGAKAVFFDGDAATEVHPVSSVLLLARTPRSEEAGPVPVTVLADEGADMAQDRFYYYDPTLKGGGTFGGPMDGTLNATVLDGTTGGPLQDAFVVLGDDPHAPFQGLTDDRGQITFSEPYLKGPLTLTATKNGYAAYTLASFDALNVTVYVGMSGSPDSLGTPPYASDDNACLVTGRIANFGKYLLRPWWSKGQVRIRCETTAPTMFGNFVDPGEGAVVDDQGRFQIRARTGKFRVVCMMEALETWSSASVPVLGGLSKLVTCDQGDEVDGIEVKVDVPFDRVLYLAFPALPAPHFSIDGPRPIGGYKLDQGGFLDILKFNDSSPFKTRVALRYQPSTFLPFGDGDGYWIYATTSTSGMGLPYGVVMTRSIEPWPSAAAFVRQTEGGQFVQLPFDARASVNDVAVFLDGTVVAADDMGATHWLSSDGGFHVLSLPTFRAALAVCGADKEHFAVVGARGSVFQMTPEGLLELETGENADFTGCAWLGEDSFVASVGRRLVLFMDGAVGHWSFEAKDPIADVASLGDGQFVAVSRSGTVVLGKPFAEPKIVDLGLDTYLTGITVGTDGTIWMVGRHGTVVEWRQGGGPVVHELRTGATLRGVVEVGPCDVVVFGDDGAIFEHDCSGFSASSPPGATQADILGGAVLDGQVWLLGRAYLDMPAYIPYPQIGEPSEGSPWDSLRIQWSYPGHADVTHHQLYLSKEGGFPFWTIMAAGDVTEVRLPPLAEILGYTPVPNSERARMNLTAIRTPNFSVDHFTSSDLNYYKRAAFSVAVQSFTVSESSPWPTSSQ